MHRITLRVKLFSSAKNIPWKSDSKSTDIGWPLKSQYLTPAGFVISCYLKSKVYASNTFILIQDYVYGKYSPFIDEIFKVTAV